MLSNSTLVNVFLTLRVFGRLRVFGGLRVFVFTHSPVFLFFRVPFGHLGIIEYTDIIPSTTNVYVSLAEFPIKIARNKYTDRLLCVD